MDALPAAKAAASPLKHADPRICASFSGEDKIDQDDLFCRRVNNIMSPVFSVTNPTAQVIIPTISWPKTTGQCDPQQGQVM